MLRLGERMTIMLREFGCEILNRKSIASIVWHSMAWRFGVLLERRHLHKRHIYPIIMFFYTQIYAMYAPKESTTSTWYLSYVRDDTPRSEKQI